MTCCTTMGAISGSMESVLIIPIPMEQDVPSQAPLQPILRKVFLEESVKRAKEYLSGALADMLDLGKGSGPMNHGFAVTGEFAGEKECWL